MLRQIAAWRAYERVPGASSFPASEAGLARHEGAPPQQIGDFIYITDDFEVKEGARLAADLYVGKPLGFGLQVSAQQHRLAAPIAAFAQIVTDTSSLQHREESSCFKMPMAR